MKLWQAVPVSLMLILGVNAVQAANNSSNKNSNQDSNNGVLTGDTRLSCEAILCLSTGTRPNECALSLKRYFSINAKHMSDTIRKRKNFLKLCPSSNEQGMPSLVDALANGAGYAQSG
ncbi:MULTISPECIES: TrbM/KikA/MpfK family conjugal transfer protein [Snodgrassella]|uniref:TrbM/KikA/MpfK family conjugal transfer protein n=1 Tax=Snodgrassella TaxID=1193515 RepID=UPI0008158548|nr:MULTISPECIES: TrbM/KikA/MpfK family conjugal transfer protein [Snodgrassella]SCC04113.1 TrbM protein [Snodgrassella sp. R-53583]